MKFFFAKETAGLIRQEQEEMETNISSLTTTSVRRGDVTSIIMHVFELTMVDGKVVNACDNVNLSKRCSLTISQFNSPHAVCSVIGNECAYKKGLSTFHWKWFQWNGVCMCPIIWDLKSGLAGAPMTRCPGKSRSK